MNIFVTGGTGFVGGHFIRCAIARGHAVTALRRPGSRARLDIPKTVRWIDGPMDDIVATQLVGHDALVHFASVGVSPQQASWREMLHWNVTVQTNLLAAARDTGVSVAVLAGSSSEYGRSADAYERIPVSAPLLPTSGYAASKAAGFVAAHAFATEQELDLRYLRIFSAYGEGQFEANFWPALREAALAGQDFDMTLGEQVRDYIDVVAVAEAFAHEAEAPARPAGSVTVRNIGTGRPVSMRQFAEHWWRVFDARGRLNVGALPYRVGELMRFVPEVEAAAGGAL